jgi:hypothetical protein
VQNYLGISKVHIVRFSVDGKTLDPKCTCGTIWIHGTVISVFCDTYCIGIFKHFAVSKFTLTLKQDMELAKC